MSSEVSPSWLNQSFLETALGSKIINYHVKPVGDANDFFTSSLYRAEVLLESGKREHLFIKKLLDKDGDGKLMAESSMFDRETYMYSIVIPKLSALLEKSSPGEESIFPHYVYSSKGVLVLEDLTPKGFLMMDRQKGLDLHYGLLVMRTLARYHAVSIILHQQEPELYEPYYNTVYAEPPIQKLQKPFFTGMTQLLAQEVANWPGFGEKYSKKFQQMAEQMIELAVKGAQRQEGRINVLTHDDLWINNLLFRPLDGIRFIDFQMPHFASLGNDLQLFLTTSLKDDVRRNHLDGLLKVYHRYFCTTLMALGYKEKLITLEELHKEYYKSSLYGFVINAVFLPSTLSRPGCVIPMFESNGPAPDRDIYEGSRVRETLGELLKQFQEQGAFVID